MSTGAGVFRDARKMRTITIATYAREKGHTVLRIVCVCVHFRTIPYSMSAITFKIMLTRSHCRLCGLIERGVTKSFHSVLITLINWQTSFIRSSLLLSPPFDYNGSQFIPFEKP